jgi:uncharacterized protein affecting Mg2+/Co2+ transport
MRNSPSTTGEPAKDKYRRGQSQRQFREANPLDFAAKGHQNAVSKSPATISKEAAMKFRFLVMALLVFVVASSGQAQTKMSGAGVCAKPDVEHAIPVSDSPGQTFTIGQGKCTWSKPWEIEGQATKGGATTFFAHTSGNTVRQSEVYVDTLASGDKVFYSYNQTATLKNNMPQPTKGKWTITSGTGKAKGIKGSGTCSITPAADGSVAFECEGEYTMPAAKSAKKS